MGESFKSELESLINRHSVEGLSDTPDFILAQYLWDCLAAWNRAHQRADGVVRPRRAYRRGGFVMTVAPTAYMRSTVQELRVSQPDTCWRPSPDWLRVCILDIGHACPCGWEPSESGRWTELIDGSEGGSDG